MSQKEQNVAVALAGYDPVSYQDAGGPLKGSEQNCAQWQGQTYCFANQANRATFERSPEQYAPAFGGHCAFAVSLDRPNLPMASPKSWLVQDGRLLVFLNPVAKLLFRLLPKRQQRAAEVWSERAVLRK